MSNRQAKPGTPVDLALAWNDHMARLLQHADTLLSEWETAARRSGETLARTMKATVAEASPAIVDELRRSLAETLRHDLARLHRETAGAARPRGWWLPALVVSNLLLAVGFVLVLVRAPSAPAQAESAAMLPDAAATVPAAVEREPPRPAAAVPASVPPPAPSCEGLLAGAKADARAVAAECARRVCGKDEARCDASLQVAARARLKCKPKGDLAKGYDVDEPWLRECLKGR